MSANTTLVIQNLIQFKLHSHHFSHQHLLSGGSGWGSSPSKTRNTSLFPATYDSSAGSTPK